MAIGSLEDDEGEFNFFPFWLPRAMFDPPAGPTVHGPSL